MHNIQLGFLETCIALCGAIPTSLLFASSLPKSGGFLLPRLPAVDLFFCPKSPDSKVCWLLLCHIFLGNQVFCEDTALNRSPAASTVLVRTPIRFKCPAQSSMAFATSTDNSLPITWITATRYRGHASIYLYRIATLSNFWVWPLRNGPNIFNFWLPL